jgi:hypothetical protein
MKDCPQGNKLLRSPFAYPRGKPRGITAQKDKTGELRLRSKPKKALTPWQTTGNKFHHLYGIFARSISLDEHTGVNQRPTVSSFQHFEIFREPHSI